MTRKSSIAQLAAPVKAAIDGALKDDKLTLDELLGYLREEYPQERLPSRTALGRYKQNFDELAKDLRESREIADVWAHKFGEMPESDIGKVVLEILRTLSYRVGADMMSGESDVSAKALSQLAKAMQYIEDAGRLSQAREEKVREAALKDASERAGEAAKAGGASEELIASLRRVVMGGQ